MSSEGSPFFDLDAWAAQLNKPSSSASAPAPSSLPLAQKVVLPPPPAAPPRRRRSEPLVFTPKGPVIAGSSQQCAKTPSLDLVSELSLNDGSSFDLAANPDMLQGQDSFSFNNPFFQPVSMAPNPFLIQQPEVASEQLQRRFSHPPPTPVVDPLVFYPHLAFQQAAASDALCHRVPAGPANSLATLPSPSGPGSALPSPMLSTSPRIPSSGTLGAGDILPAGSSLTSTPRTSSGGQFYLTGPPSNRSSFQGEVSVSGSESWPLTVGKGSPPHSAPLADEQMIQSALAPFGEAPLPNGIVTPSAVEVHRPLPAAPGPIPAAPSLDDDFTMFVLGRAKTTPPQSPPRAATEEAAMDGMGDAANFTDTGLLGGAPPSGTAATGSVWDTLASESRLSSTGSAAEHVCPSPPVKGPQQFVSPPLSRDVAISGPGQGRNVGPGRVSDLHRPPWLEIRPAPLRGSPSDQPARALVCTRTAVWVAVDGGIRVWDATAAMTKAVDGGNNMAGEEDAAAYTLIAVYGPSRCLCLAVDTGRQVIWSGHSDGKARAWSLQVGGPGSSDGDGSGLMPSSALLLWQAHKSDITAMVVTPYGELWTGSESGSIRVWPAAACTRAVAQGSKGDHTGPEHMTQAGQDLAGTRAPAGPEGAGRGPIHSEVRFLVVEPAGSRVWSGGQNSVALWDARTHTVLQVIGTNLNNEFSAATAPRPSSREPSPLRTPNGTNPSPPREEMVVNRERGGFTRLSAKGADKATLNALTFLRKSKEAVFRGAAAVKQAAGWVDEDTRLSAIAGAGDGTMWTGYGDGRLIQWDWAGTRLQEITLVPVPVRSMCGVGLRLWVGYADGRVHVLNARSGRRLAVWRAHTKEVIRLAWVPGSAMVYSMASRGGVRAWSARSPGPADGVVQAAMGAAAERYTRSKNVRVLAATWNVNEQKASQISVQGWLSSASTEAAIVVVGLQEMEMGAGSLASSLAKETVGMGLQEKGSAASQSWLKEIGAALGDTSDGPFERVGSRQLAGMLVGVWVHRRLLPYVGDVDTGSVSCGFGRALGNKGAVGVRLAIFRRMVCFLSSHFAAHKEAVARRNADYEHILQRMEFGRYQGAAMAAAAAAAAAVGSAAGGVSKVVKELLNVAAGPPRGTLIAGGAGGRPMFPEDEGLPLAGEATDGGAEGRPDMAEMDLVVWIGDFNYRIDNLLYEDVVDAVRDQHLDILLQNDQLRREMAGGRAFVGMREGPVTFPPTYKFDKGSSDPLGYDSSEKKRIPAWCDRVVFRDSYGAEEAGQEKGGTSLAMPVKTSVLRYDCCMDVTDSDHKPVRALLDVELAVVDESAKRKEYGRVLLTDPTVRQLTAEAEQVPDTSVSDQCICLEGRARAVLCITNHSDQLALFSIGGDGEAVGTSDVPPSRGATHVSGFPQWLGIRPASGVIASQQCVVVDVTFQRQGGDEDGEGAGSFGENHRWLDDHKDVGAAVLVVVRGCFSTTSEEHPVLVFHGPNARRRCGLRSPSLTKATPPPPDLMSF